MLGFTLCFQSKMSLYRGFSYDVFGFKFMPQRPDFLKTKEWEPSNGKLRKSITESNRLTF